MKKFVFITSLIFFLTVAINVSADTIGEKRLFSIESSYDLSGRKEITAVLVKVASKVYFYVDESWWSFTPQNEVYQNLSDLGEEFDNKIYPILTSAFGPEWNPGIDKDPKITVLIHPMKKEAGGYFRSNDEYPKIQITDSNQREMVYLNADYIRSSLAKSLLAHEFVHLITFNQKENSYDASEKTWLNEARAEYASILVGYDDTYNGSNLEKRVQIFSDNSSDSIIDWQNEKKDYGSINLFVHYLVDHYGVAILADSLHSPKTGIESINYALEKNGFKENFSQIFLDWTIAVLINDCNYGSKYCYLNLNLKDFHISPQINFLPISGQSTLILTDLTKAWSGNWYKIIGGKGTLKFSFIEGPNGNFQVPYITKNKSGAYNVKFLEFDKNRKGEVYFEDFGTEIVSLILIPSLKDVIEDNNFFYTFSWLASIEKTNQELELIQELLAKIAELKAEIARVQEKINAILDNRESSVCQTIKVNLYYGLNNEEVKCLQIFLKSQGSEIYPEGLTTGYFGILTQSAVIRFQEKYASEILTPLGLTSGTGFVGQLTRVKINELLNI